MMINFAHSEIFMLGAFAGLGAVGWAAGRGLGSGATLLLAFSAAMLGSGLLGLLTERFAYRPLRHASKLAPLISAIGVSIIFQNAAFLWITNQTVSFPSVFE